MDRLPSELNIHLLELASQSDLRTLLSLSGVHPTIHKLYSDPAIQKRLLFSYANALFARAFFETQTLCLLLSLFPTEQNYLFSEVTGNGYDSRRGLTSDLERMKSSFEELCGQIWESYCERAASERDLGLRKGSRDFNREPIYNCLKDVCPLKIVKGMIRTHGMVLALWRVSRISSLEGTYVYGKVVDYDVSRTPDTDSEEQWVLNIYSHLVLAGIRIPSNDSLSCHRFSTHEARENMVEIVGELHYLPLDFYLNQVNYDSSPFVDFRRAYLENLLLFNILKARQLIEPYSPTSKFPVIGYDGIVHGHDTLLTTYFTPCPKFHQKAEDLIIKNRIPSSFAAGRKYRPFDPDPRYGAFLLSRYESSLHSEDFYRNFAEEFLAVATPDAVYRAFCASKDADEALDVVLRTLFPRFGSYTWPPVVVDEAEKLKRREQESIREEREKGLEGRGEEYEKEQEESKGARWIGASTHFTCKAKNEPESWVEDEEKLQAELKQFAEEDMLAYIEEQFGDCIDIHDLYHHQRETEDSFNRMHQDA